MKISKFYLFSCLLIIIEIITLIYFQQPIVSQTGEFYLFWPQGSGIENSQQLSDCYSLSHFSHGIIFFFLLTFILNKLKVEKFPSFKSFEFKLFLATFVEVAWEILENSPIIINRYRLTGLAAGYFGDSVLNSVSDIFFMLAGFYFAKKLGWKFSLFIVIFFELLSLYFIKDNLILNIIMLIYPVESINAWQISV